MKLDVSPTVRERGFHREVELKNFILKIKRFSLRLDGARNGYRLDLVCEVPNRDTGEPFMLHWARFMDDSFDEEALVRDIYGEVQNMMLHELAEAWIVDGVRTEDPHG